MKVDLDTPAAVEGAGSDVLDEENAITLSNSALGMICPRANLPALIDSYGDNSDGWTDDLEDLHPSWNVIMRGHLGKNRSDRHQTALKPHQQHDRTEQR